MDGARENIYLPIFWGECPGLGGDDRRADALTFHLNFYRFRHLHLVRPQLNGNLYWSLTEWLVQPGRDDCHAGTHLLPSEERRVGGSVHGGFPTSSPSDK